MADVTVKIGCQCCGKMSTLVVDKDKLARWQQRGELIQDVFPELSPADRELLISQTCNACFHELFREPEEDD